MSKLEKAISMVKNYGYEIGNVNVNTSGKIWEVSEDSKTIFQPLSSIKNLGDAAIEEILLFRPFNTIEEFLFHSRMSYSKLNKRKLDALCRSGALDCLIDKRFSGGKHFWSAVAVERPRKEKDLLQNIAKFAPEGDFSLEEKIINMLELTGQYPVGMIMNDKTRKRLEDKCIPPISEFDPELGICWFIPKSMIEKRTKKGKKYLVISCIDDTNSLTDIKCWSYNPEKDKVQLHRPFLARLEYDENWGFSTRSIKHNFRLLG